MFQVTFFKCSYNVVAGRGGFPWLSEPCHMWPPDWCQLWGPVLQLPAWENAALLSWHHADCTTRQILSGEYFVLYQTGTLRCILCSLLDRYAQVNTLFSTRQVHSGEYFVLYQTGTLRCILCSLPDRYAEVNTSFSTRQVHSGEYFVLYQTGTLRWMFCSVQDWYSQLDAVSFSALM